LPAVQRPSPSGSALGWSPERTHALVRNAAEQFSERVGKEGIAIPPLAEPTVVGPGQPGSFNDPARSLKPLIHQLGELSNQDRTTTARLATIDDIINATCNVTKIGKNDFFSRNPRAQLPFPISQIRQFAHFLTYFLLDIPEEELAEAFQATHKFVVENYSTASSLIKQNNTTFISVIQNIYKEDFAPSPEI
jgi:hypothetical protein